MDFIERTNPAEETLDAARLARGVARWLFDLGHEALSEFRLANGRRSDVIGLDKSGRFIIVEVKTSPADLRADTKWPDYLDHCDEFYFAVPEDFPRELLPDEHGILIADSFGAAVLRAAPEAKMNGARRTAQTRRFARAAGARLRALIDPRL
ncbi:MAG TPA: MmcB family DNA repair protein [Alphaproteobacteria bacterium]|nr:MmcB family DNA repair protein [Alphaproteobacteria bacterium]